MSGIPQFIHERTYAILFSLFFNPFYIYTHFFCYKFNGASLHFRIFLFFSWFHKNVCTLIRNKYYFIVRLVSLLLLMQKELRRCQRESQCEYFCEKGRRIFLWTRFCNMYKNVLIYWTTRKFNSVFLKFLPLQTCCTQKKT